MTANHKTLAEIVGVDPNRSEVVAACVELVNDEVKAKKGIKGVAIKGAYGTVKRIKPRFVGETIDALLDDWLAKMQPHFETWQSGGQGSFGDYVAAHADDVAEDLLSVTDERAETSKHKTATKLYKKLRPKAKIDVASAAPKLGALIDGYLGGDSARSATS